MHELIFLECSWSRYRTDYRIKIDWEKQSYCHQNVMFGKRTPFCCLFIAKKIKIVCGIEILIGSTVTVSASLAFFHTYTTVHTFCLVLHWLMPLMSVYIFYMDDLVGASSSIAFFTSIIYIAIVCPKKDHLTFNA